MKSLFFFFVLCLCSFALTEQEILDAIAAAIQAEGKYPNCQAPVAVGSLPVVGSNCGIFNIDGSPIKSLALGGNGMKTFPTAICSLAGLTYLSLYDNQITDIPTEIGLLTSLAGLDFSVNSISHIPTEIGLLTSLEWLYFDNNFITVIPTQFKNLNSLNVNMEYPTFKNNYLDVTAAAKNLPPHIASDANDVIGTQYSCTDITEDDLVCENSQIKCGAGAFKTESNTCDLCVEGCTECDNDETCIKCNDGWGRKSDSTCEKCGEGLFVNGETACKQVTNAAVSLSRGISSGLIALLIILTTAIMS